MWVGGPENDLRHGRTRGGLRRYYQRITGRELALKALGQAVCTVWMSPFQHDRSDPVTRAWMKEGARHRYNAPGWADRRTQDYFYKRNDFSPDFNGNTLVKSSATCLLSECLLKSSLSLLNTSILLFSRWVLSVCFVNLIGLFLAKYISK